MNQFRKLPNNIAKLKSLKLTIFEQYDIIVDFEKKIKDEEASNKFKNILNINPGFDLF